MLFLRSAMHKLLQPFTITLLDGDCLAALGDAVRLRGWCAACLGADNLPALAMFHSLAMQDETVLDSRCSHPCHPHISCACKVEHALLTEAPALELLAKLVAAALRIVCQGG